MSHRETFSMDEVNQMISQTVKGGMMTGLRASAESLRATVSDLDALIGSLAKDHDLVLNMILADRDQVRALVRLLVADIADWLDEQAAEVAKGETVAVEIVGLT